MKFFKRTIFREFHLNIWRSQLDSILFTIQRAAVWKKM